MNSDHIHVLNPGPGVAIGRVTLGGGSAQTFTLAAGQETWFTWALGTFGGPIEVSVQSGPGVVASQRVEFNKSFSEIAGQR